MIEQVMQYLYNVASGSPVRIEHFDDDHEPIGPQLRKDLVARGLITESDGMIIIVEK